MSKIVDAQWVHAQDVESIGGVVGDPAFHAEVCVEEGSAALDEFVELVRHWVRGDVDAGHCEGALGERRMGGDVIEVLKWLVWTFVVDRILLVLAGSA